MGFEQEQAQQALARSGGDVAAALDLRGKQTDNNSKPYVLVNK